MDACNTSIARMKIVIISEGTPRERVVLYSVLYHFEDVTWLMPSKQKNNNSSFTDAANADLSPKSKSGKFNQLLNKIYNKIHKLYLERHLKEFNPHNLEFKKAQIHFTDLKNETGINLLKSLEPDIILTCRAPILRPEVLEIPKLAAINVHYGIAPKYRGNDTLFWALFDRDAPHIGATVHYINDGVDRGNILALISPELSTKETELSLDIKTTKLLAKATVQVLKDLEKMDRKPNFSVQHKIPVQVIFQ